MSTRQNQKILFITVIILFLLLTISGCSNPPASTPEDQAVEGALSQPTSNDPDDNPQGVIPDLTEAPASEPSPEATSTAEPTATDTPQPTVPSEVKFSIDDAHKELPDNFMEQITYFGHAGGGGDWEDYNPCEEFPRSVPVYKYEPKVNTCLFCDYDLTTCGWNPNEKVRITVQLRGRGSFKTTEQASEYGYLEYKLPASADDLPGDYTIALAGQNGKLKTTFFKDAPTETGSVLFGDQLILFNFLPYEKFRLTIYQVTITNLYTSGGRGDYKFIGWQDYQVDAAGGLRIQFDSGSDTRLDYQINAEQSGIYPRIKWTNTNTKEVTVTYADFGCGTQESSFAINDLIQVTAPDGAPFYRALEGYEQIPDQVIPTGETGRITGGPHCYEETIYWQVIFGDNRTGWMPQQARFNEVPYIELVK